LKLEIDPEKKIHGMYSEEGEYVGFVDEVDTSAANGNVDLWLIEVEDRMIKSVRHQTEKAVNEYSNVSRPDWVKGRCGMCVLGVSMTYWTRESEEAINTGDQNSVKAYHNKLKDQVYIFTFIWKIFFSDCLVRTDK